MNLWVLAISLMAQSSNQTAPLPNPYGPVLQRSSPAVRASSPRGRVRNRAIWIGTALQETRIVEQAIVEKQDPLKDLVISPVYQREKITPKMIEIP